MKDVVIRPTMRYIRMGYTTIFVLVGLALALASNVPDVPLWIAAALAFLLALPAWRQLRRRFIRLILTGDKLRYEVGLFSRTTRTFQLSKIQDVRVEQTFLERLLKVGDLSIETAGESGSLVIRNIDHPHEVADMIAEASEQQPSKRVSGL